MTETLAVKIHRKSEIQLHGFQQVDVKKAFAAVTVLIPSFTKLFADDMKMNRNEYHPESLNVFH